MSEFNTPGDGGQTPRQAPGQSPYQIPRNVPVPGPAVREAEQREQERTHTRVAIVIAALVATVGAVVLGFAITSGHGGKLSTNAGARPHAVVDPSSPGSTAAPGGVGSPTALPTLSGGPAPPPTPDQAQAAQQAFAPPTSVPANVPGYSGSAPLDAVVMPPFLTVTVPSVQAKDTKAQALADQSTLLLKAWVEAWTSGNTYDPRYRTLCVAQCRAVLDPTVALWKNANIIPAGTLRFFNLAGGVATGDDQSGEVGVCLDDSTLTAFRGGSVYRNPYPLGAQKLLVFGLVYDQAVGHWVATEAYASPGDSYCAQDSGSSSG
jgi:hypothetical protein